MKNIMKKLIIAGATAVVWVLFNVELGAKSDDNIE